MNSTVLYFTQERYDYYVLGNVVIHNSRPIRVTSKALRPEFGDYFEITYYYV